MKNASIAKILLAALVSSPFGPASCNKNSDTKNSDMIVRRDDISTNEIYRAVLADKNSQHVKGFIEVACIHGHPRSVTLGKFQPGNIFFLEKEKGKAAKLIQQPTSDHGTRIKFIELTMTKNEVTATRRMEDGNYFCTEDGPDIPAANAAFPSLMRLFNVKMLNP